MKEKRLLVLGDEARAKWHRLSELQPLLERLREAGYSVECSEEYPALTEKKLQEYDVCINYIDAWEERGTEQAALALSSWLVNGGRLLSLHNGAILKKSPELLMLQGAEFTGHPEYQRLYYPVSEKSHPILKGVNSFYLEEEPYRLKLLRAEELDVFLQYEHGGVSYPAAWTAPAGAGKLVYLSIGHHAGSFREPMVQLLCINGLEWLMSV